MPHCLYIGQCIIVSCTYAWGHDVVSILAILTETDRSYAVHTRTEAEIDEVLGPQRTAVFKPHYRVKVQALPSLELSGVCKMPQQPVMT